MKEGRFVVDTHVHAQRFAAGRNVSERPPEITGGSQVLTQDSPGVPDTAESGDNFGVALASGDFDHDGFADLAVGVELEEVGDAAGAGGVNVLYGSAGGLTGTGSQFFPQVGGAVERNDLSGGR